MIVSSLQVFLILCTTGCLEAPYSSPRWPGLNSINLGSNLGQEFGVRSGTMSEMGGIHPFKGLMVRNESALSDIHKSYQEIET